MTKPLRIYGQVGAKIYKTSQYFWEHYQNLPRAVQQIADNKFELLKQNPRHPSLHLKKVGTRWAARINRDYRALAREENGTLVGSGSGSTMNTCGESANEILIKLSYK